MRAILHIVSLVALCAFALVVHAADMLGTVMAPAPGALLMVPAPQRGYVLIDAPPFLNVAATGKATSRLDNIIGYTLDRLILELGGTALTKAMLTNIKLYANEKVIFDDTGSRTDTRMQYRGISANAAYLTIDFSEIRARTITGQHAGSIDTIATGIGKLQLEIDIAGATAPLLTAFAMCSAGGQTDPSFNRLCSKTLNRTFNPGGAGEFAFDMSYARVPGSFIKRVFLFGATVTAARVKKNGTEFHKATSARESYLQTEFLRTPQANVVCLDFVVDGNMSEAIPLQNAASMEWYVTASGAGNIVVVTELLDLLENN